MASIGSEWRSRLKAHGYVPSGTGGRRGTYCIRDRGAITQAVGVLVDEEYREGSFNIQLNLNMVLRSSEPRHDVIVLLADLSPGPVRIQEPWDHGPDLVTWWKTGELEASWAAFESFGLLWLEKYGNVEELISYFENEYCRLSETYSKKARPSLAFRALDRLRLVSRQPAPPYQQYLLWLSMLSAPFEF